MKFYEALGEVIKEERAKQKLTLRDVSSRGFVSMGHLSDVENARKEGSESFIQAVANALDVPAYELIIEAGYRMAGFEIPDTIEDLFGELRFDTPVR